MYGIMPADPVVVSAEPSCDRELHWTRLVTAELSDRVSTAISHTLQSSSVEQNKLCLVNPHTHTHT